MVMALFKLHEEYWEDFELRAPDYEFLYNYLLETETPQTPRELLAVLVKERIDAEKKLLAEQRQDAGDIYLPKGKYTLAQKLVFPASGWRSGEVIGIRQGQNPDLGDFDVIKVAFAKGDECEFAAGLEHHSLNSPLEIRDEDPGLDPSYVMDLFGEHLLEQMEIGLEEHEDFVRIAGRWFPRALLVDINVGHLNLAEAVLDMAGGGPLSTSALIEQIGIVSSANPNLLEFSLDLALQEDQRFDEVGASGEVLWFLHRLEPAEVLEPPLFLKYSGIDYDRSVLSSEMLALEQKLDDELSPLAGNYKHLNEVEVTLIFPHWRAGTLPLSAKLRHLFPTAYESPRIRFTVVDGETGEKYPAWVVRSKRYVYGLRGWYDKHNLQPGSIVKVARGKIPGEVIVHSGSRRPNREWIRTVLVGSDGGIVYAMLKQAVHSILDDRMAVAVSDVTLLDPVWMQGSKEKQPFERIVANTVRELAKLNPQGHVHASELYAAINIIKRCPPGPIFHILASRNAFVHLGDLHFRITDVD